MSFIIIFKATEDIVFKCASVIFSSEPIAIDVKPITYEELYDTEETTL